MKKVKEDVWYSTMTLVKGREIVFKAFKRRIFSQLEQSEQSEESKQSSSNDKYTSPKLNNDLITSSNTSSNTLNSSFSRDIENQLFTPIIKKRNRSNINF